MTDWLHEHHQNRCEGKKAYRTADAADRKAERASRKTGQLIISYKCPDCGYWHIGHADHAQVRARHMEQTSNFRFCNICNYPIPQYRIDYAAACKSPTYTCSRQCTEIARQRRRQRRRQQKPPVS